MHFNCSLKLLRVFTAAGLSATCLALAVFLRGYKENLLRENITLMLGYEWRAAVEHLLTAIGVPLALSISFLSLTVTLCWVSYGACKLRCWTWPPFATHPREIATFELLAALVWILATVYVLLAIVWEWSQAYVGVYGGPPRLYLQWWQLCSDFMGASIAICVSRWASKSQMR